MGVASSPVSAPPRFSVIMPAYCSARTIGSAIESALEQSFVDFELIVVDDGSTDQTAAIVSAYAALDPRVELLSQRNAGPSAARNAAIERARGRFISFLDSDDAWFPTYLDRAVTTLEADPAIGLAHADAMPYNDATGTAFRQSALEYYGREGPQAAGAELLESLLRVNFMTASAVTVRREALERVGGFALDLAGAEDWDLWLRILAAGFEAALIDDRPLVLLREHPGSYSKDKALMARNSILVLDRFIDSGPAPAALPIAVQHRDQLRRTLVRLEDPTWLQATGARLRRAVSVLIGPRLRRRRWPDAIPELRRLAEERLPSGVGVAASRRVSLELGDELRSAEPPDSVEGHQPSKIPAED